jgi:uncharacterized membrane protein YhaH (DUF805 family)
MHALLSTRGRSTRTRFALEALSIGAVFALADAGVERTLGRDATLLLLPPLFWLLFAAACRRLHDHDCSGWRLALLLIPLAGPAIIAAELLLLSGTKDANRFGVDPRARVVDYFQVG